MRVKGILVWDWVAVREAAATMDTKKVTLKCSLDNSGTPSLEVKGGGRIQHSEKGVNRYRFREPGPSGGSGWGGGEVI